MPLPLLFVNKSSAGDDKTGGGEDDYFEWGLETYFKCQLALPFARGDITKSGHLLHLIACKVIVISIIIAGSIIIINNLVITL